jgi:hypothetical protein
VSAAQLTREQILALPPVISLAQLAQVLGLSEPVVRASLRRGELERLGIRVNKLGAQWRAITSTVWDYLGISPDGGGSTVPASRKSAGQLRQTASALRAVASRAGGEA